MPLSFQNGNHSHVCHLECGGVIRKRQGHLVLESYPNNARCEWTIQVDRPFTIDLR